LDVCILSFPGSIAFLGAQQSKAEKQSRRHGVQPNKQDVSSPSEVAWRAAAALHRFTAQHHQRP
ncbi:hypothetical protein NDU88_000494, partial [Pleurodeles waltl]